VPPPASRHGAALHASLPASSRVSLTMGPQKTTRVVPGGAAHPLDRGGPGTPELDRLPYHSCCEIVAKSKIEGHRGRILSGPVPCLVDFGQR
jgi:hypothetical protein